MDREEDRVVARRRGRSVVDGIPLPILRRVGRDRVLPPRVPAVVRNGNAQVRETLEVDEVGEPLVVGHDVRVTAARRRVGSLGRGGQMERVATVRRAVDETQLRGRSPRPGFPDFTVEVYVDHRFAFRADRIGDRARTEGDASGRTRRVRDRSARREREGGGSLVVRTEDEERHHADFVDARRRELEEDRFGRRPSGGGRGDLGASGVVDVEVEVVVAGKPGDADGDAARVLGPEGRGHIDGQEEVVTPNVGRVGRGRTRLGDRGRHHVERTVPREPGTRLRHGAARRACGPHRDRNHRDQKDDRREGTKPPDAQAARFSPGPG